MELFCFFFLLNCHLSLFPLINCFLYTYKLWKYSLTHVMDKRIHGILTVSTPTWRPSLATCSWYPKKRISYFNLFQVATSVNQFINFMSPAPQARSKIMQGKKQDYESTNPMYLKYDLNNSYNFIIQKTDICCWVNVLKFYHIKFVNTTNIEL